MINSILSFVFNCFRILSLPIMFYLVWRYILPEWPWIFFFEDHRPDEPLLDVNDILRFFGVPLIFPKIPSFNPSTDVFLLDIGDH